MPLKIMDHWENKFITGYQKTVSFFNSVPDPIWEERLYTDGQQWSVHEVFAHIVEATGSSFRLFSNIVSGGPGARADFDIDEHNAKEVGKISSKSKAELFLLYQEGFNNILSLLQALSDDERSKIGSHPFLGQATLEEMFRIYLVHINLHIRDIRNLFGERLG